MTKTASARIILLKKIALLPLLTGLVYFLCAETVAQQKNTPTAHEPQKIDHSARDAYFAGVRIKVYKNAVKTKNGILKGDITMDKLYEELTAEEKDKYKMWFFVPTTTVKKSPTSKELEEYKNSSKFAIWIDGKNVPNNELDNYKPEDIAYFSGSSVLKNARTKKHPQPFQFWFYTHPYFEKEQIGKEKKHYGGDLIEVFENLDGKNKKKQTVVVNRSSPDVSTTAEKQPSFQGGLEKFYAFIGQHFKVPNVKNLKGKVMVEFIVETDGSLSEIKVLKDIGYGTGDEAIRVLKSSPKWNPGEQDGKPVRVLYSLPISITTK